MGATSENVPPHQCFRRDRSVAFAVVAPPSAITRNTRTGRLVLTCQATGLPFATADSPERGEFELSGDFVSGRKHLQSALRRSLLRIRSYRQMSPQWSPYVLVNCAKGHPEAARRKARAEQRHRGCAARFSRRG